MELPHLSGDQVVLDLALGVELNGEYVGLLIAGARSPRVGLTQVHRVLGHVDLGEGAAISKVGRHSRNEALPEIGNSYCIRAASIEFYNPMPSFQSSNTQTGGLIHVRQRKRGIYKWA